MQIRPIQTHEEFREIVRLQKAVWKFPDLEAVPVNELIVAQKVGGAVLGAFDRGRMIGFCFSVPGYDGKKVFHHSRMLGVLPDYQDKGVGFLLKCAQRKAVLAQGLDLVQWTFDPLQSRNAYFNIVKLGCVVRSYWVNLYGTSGSAFNRGMETDRFAPDWWVRSRRVEMRLRNADRSTTLELPDDVLNETRVNRHGFRETTRLHLSRPPRRCAVEIPSNIDALKKKDLALARAWRTTTRKIFTTVLGKGWAVTDFAVNPDASGLRCFYIMEKQ